MHEALNHAKLAMLFRKEFELCNVQKGETIVLLSDLGARRGYVSAAFAAAEDLGADAYEMCVNAVPSWTKVGVETVGRCKGTLEAIKSADMLVCLHIPLFTRWLKEARDASTRVLMAAPVRQGGPEGTVASAVWRAAGGDCRSYGSARGQETRNCVDQSRARRGPRTVQEKPCSNQSPYAVGTGSDPNSTAKRPN